MADLPKGWKTVALKDIFTPEQIGRTVEIMKRPGTDTERTALLRDYYTQFKDELSAKGYNADYLAYAVPYWIGQSAEEAAARDKREAVDMTNKFTREMRNQG